MRSVVLVHGLLHGLGYEARCEMLAMRESASREGSSTYSRCSVIDAPMDLPDGDYTVTFGGYSVLARKQAGLWVPDDGVAEVMAPLLENSAQPRQFRAEEAVEILPILKNHVA